MYLKKPLWSEGMVERGGKGGDSSGSGSGSSSSSSSDAAKKAAVVGGGGGGAVCELVNSLQQQRVYREVTLALTTGLRDARAEFSFLRVRALRSILKFLRSVAQSDSTIHLFNQTQSIPHLQGLCFFIHCFSK